jgi:magnesium-transporting ATPase (P-type)
LIGEFLKCLAVAHECLPEEKVDKKDKTKTKKKFYYQGPSPDEIALVEMAQSHGYEYIYGSEQSRKIRIR